MTQFEQYIEDFRAEELKKLFGESSVYKRKDCHDFFTAVLNYLKVERIENS